MAYPLLRMGAITNLTSLIKSQSQQTYLHFSNLLYKRNLHRVKELHLEHWLSTEHKSVEHQAADTNDRVDSVCGSRALTGTGFIGPRGLQR